MNLDNHYFFVDLDETLFHSEMSNHDKRPNTFGFKLDDGWYYSQLRSGSLWFLAELRKLVGNERVNVITTSTNDYANRNNEILGLGFRPDQIYHRGHRDWLRRRMDTRYVVKPIEGLHKDATASLIDNLPVYELGEKLTLMGHLGFRDRHRFVHTIREYWGDYGPEPKLDALDALTKNDLQNITQAIENSLKE